MARAGRGHPHPVTLGRILLSDAIVAGLGAAWYFIGIAPYYAATLQKVDWYWELAAVAAGLGLVAALARHAKALGRRFEPQIKWLQETYQLAKARRDLSAFETMSGLEKVVFGVLFGQIVFGLFVPIVPLVRIAYLNWDWIDSIGGSLLLLAPIFAMLPLVAVGWRLSVYGAVHIAARLTGSPPR